MKTLKVLATVILSLVLTGCELPTGPEDDCWFMCQLTEYGIDID